MGLIVACLVVVLIVTYLIDYPRLKTSDMKLRSTYLVIFGIGFVGLLLYGMQLGVPGIPLISIH